MVRRFRLKIETDAQNFETNGSALIFPLQESNPPFSSVFHEMGGGKSCPVGGLSLGASASAGVHDYVPQVVAIGNMRGQRKVGTRNGVGDARRTARTRSFSSTCGGSQPQPPEALRNGPASVLRCGKLRLRRFPLHEVGALVERRRACAFHPGLTGNVVALQLAIERGTADA
jgi:hypothetical protein